jgi:hypothetical protein
MSTLPSLQATLPEHELRIAIACIEVPVRSFAYAEHASAGLAVPGASNAIEPYGSASDARSETTGVGQV